MTKLMKPQPDAPVKAPRRHAKPMSKALTKRVFKDIDANVPRDELYEALDYHADSDDRCRVMLGLLINPAPGQDKITMFTAARKAGLKPTDLIDLIRTKRLHVGILRATEHLPDIMEDTAIDAKSTDETCLKCEGNGQIVKGVGKDAVAKVCADCRGRGTIHVLGDIENRKLMWEVTGLIQRGAKVAINQNFGVSPAESFESLIGRASKVIDASSEPSPPETKS